MRAFTKPCPLRILAALTGFYFVLSAHVAGNSIALDPALAANGLTANPTSLSICVGNAAMFSVSDANSTATSVTATSANSSIATVSPSTRSLDKSLQGSFNVQAKGTGSSAVDPTIINLGDLVGGTASVSVTTTGPLSVPAASQTLNFNGSGSGGTNSQTFAVLDPGPNVNVTATIISASPAIATFDNGSTTASAVTSNGSVQFTIVPVGSTTSTQATATISLRDDFKCVLNSAATINVKPGSVTITSPTNSPPSLTFAGPNDSAQSIQGTDANYAGSLSAVLGNCSPDCGIATITGPATAPGAANTFTYNVTPKKLGNGTVTVTGSTSQTVKVLVNGASITATGGSPVSFGTNGSIGGSVSSDVTSTPISVTGALQTSGTGTGSVYIGTPGDIATGSGTLPISALSYNCSAIAGFNQGASVSGTQQLSANSIATPCMTFSSGQYSNLNFNLNLILNKDAANSLPAATYSSPSGFTLYISAT